MKGGHVKAEEHFKNVVSVVRCIFSEHQWILEGDERRFMESKWICVLSQYVPEINVGNINRCVVCGGVKADTRAGEFSTQFY